MNTVYCEKCVHYEKAVYCERDVYFEKAEYCHNAAYCEHHNWNITTFYGEDVQ